MKIVIAIYNENVEWTRQFPNVIIYNKGLPLENGYDEVFLDNVGREGHTYYKYICDNYNNLEDYTVFLQGTPFDHSPNIITNLHNINNNINYTKQYTDFEFLSEGIHFSNFDSQISINLECKNLYDTYERIFGVKCGNNQCIFGDGSQFIVSRYAILKNTKEFYENIVKILEYSICPTECYDVERLHKYILG